MYDTNKLEKLATRALKYCIMTSLLYSILIKTLIKIINYNIHIKNKLLANIA